MKTKTCSNCKEAKPINKFRPQRTECNTCCNKKATERQVTLLPDCYIIKCIIRHKKVSKDTVTLQQIVEHRNFILLKRQASSMDQKKLCWSCKTIKDKSEFVKSGRGRCFKCRAAAQALWKKNNPEKVRLQANRSLAKHSAELSDTYISNNLRKTLNQNKGLNISMKDIPQELIDLKRKELLIKRKIQNKQ